VIDQFGIQLYRLQNIEHLMVPASKSHLPNPPGDPPSSLGHFKCYKVVAATVFSPVSPVTLTDQFHTEVVTVQKPERLCNPVEKTHGDDVHPILREDPNAHLMCYSIKDVPPVRRFDKRTVAVRDQFLRQIVDVQKAALLCVPASKIELP
jgi:hypothetical protein